MEDFKYMAMMYQTFHFMFGLEGRNIQSFSSDDPDGALKRT